MMKKIIFSFLFIVHSFWFACYAEEITILYTGETHAMLYPCSCPIEPDGGISRRLSLIKQIRKTNPDLLLLDSGGFFAGGALDQYSQSTQLDMQRTAVNLQAMELMQYDAAAIGDDEFNFGKDALEANIAKTRMPFLSCNIKSDKLSGYIIKEVKGIKIGIIGLTNPQAGQKAGGVEVIEPKAALKQAVEEVKKKGAGITVLLSHLGESDDINLIKEIKGIDILITGHSRSSEEPFSKIGNTLILRPSWQGRRIGRATLNIKDNKVAGFKVEELRLSDKISDDPQILAILPRCFSDANCKKEGLIGSCQNPGTLNATCLFTEAAKINLTIITSKACVTCNTEQVVSFLKKQFPGLSVSYLYYPDKKAAKLLKDFNLSGLPVYLLGKEAAKEKNFDSLKDKTEIKGDFYLLKPQMSGVSYFTQRKNIKGRIDLFLSLYDKNTAPLLEAVKEFNPGIHFLAIVKENKVDTARGNLEAEEYLRAVCVQKYYPQELWNYLQCRAKNINSSWWEDCAANMEANKIRTCARGAEGIALLSEDVMLNKELEIMFGPTFLVDNQEIFSIQGVPGKEELKKIFKR